ncbi:MAG: SurA N-terminal domain-containing protein [Deltaproteobacteria bacterium]|nr:SurA N-terminal domain-containing protein [Deltaproteobacteria bacterium]
MLDKLRKEKQSSWSWALTLMIIVTFLFFFGPGSFRRTRGGCGVISYAAKVNHSVISIEDFNFAYTSRFREMQRYNPNFSREMAKSMNLRQSVMDELVDIEILAQMAEKYNLVVSDEEVARNIAESPMFQQNGEFDYNLYEKIVRYHMQITPKKFEEKQKKRILAVKLLELMKDSVKVDEESALKDYLKRNNKVNLYYVKFDPRLHAKNVKVEEKEIDDLLKNEYQKVETYYNTHISEFSQPKQYRARHILLKLAQNAGEAEEKKILEKAKKIIADIKSGAKFEDLAKQYSEDEVSRVRGGDLDYFPEGRMVKPFEEAVKKLGVGEITEEPVRTIFGYHIIKMEGTREASKKELKEVEREIARRIITENKAEEMVKADAEKLLAEIKEGKKLEELVPREKEHDHDTVVVNAPEPDTAVLKETGMFNSSQNYIQGIGTSEELIKRIFTEKGVVESLTDIVKVGNFYYLVSIKEREVKTKEDFEKEKEQYIKMLEASRQGAVIQDFIKSLREKAKVTINTTLVSYDEKRSKDMDF